MILPKGGRRAKDLACDNRSQQGIPIRRKEHIRLPGFVRCALGPSRRALRPLGHYGAFGGGASGAGALPLSVAVPTLVEIEPRISESAWMFFIL